MKYGCICIRPEDDGHVEWWVRRKEDKKSNIVITREAFQDMNGVPIKIRVTKYEIDYVLSRYCECPEKVKQIAKELKEKLVR